MKGLIVKEKEFVPFKFHLYDLVEVVRSNNPDSPVQAGARGWVRENSRPAGKIEPRILVQFYSGHVEEFLQMDLRGVGEPIVPTINSATSVSDEELLKEAPERKASFLEDLFDLYCKHNMSISHEDCHGAFELTDYDDDNIQWMEASHVILLDFPKSEFQAPLSVIQETAKKATELGVLGWMVDESQNVTVEDWERIVKLLEEGNEPPPELVMLKQKRNSK